MKTSSFKCIAVLALALGLAGPVTAAPIHGALFTTDAAGSVNVNIYAAKADVYLNGGPGPNAPCTAAGVDDGTYVYQVTNPSGSVVLSSDAIEQREFTVLGGVIVSANDHGPTVAGDCGSVRVPLAPFADTPNNGGEYKAWITRKSDYIANGNTFAPGSTKTDNFKVDVEVVIPGTAGLLVYKFYDANGNGEWDGDEVPLFGWNMTVENGAGYNATGQTQSPDGLVTFSGLAVDDSPYQVTEGTGGPAWQLSAVVIDGVPTNSPTNPVAGLNLVTDQTTQVDFGNYCKCVIKPYPTNYWLGLTGRNKLNDGLTMKPEFTALRNANLRSASGGQFNFNLLLAEADNYNTFSAWLMGAASSTNEAYKLSVQLAVLKLNIEAGFVRGVNFDKKYGATITQLVADANLMVSNTVCGTTCNTTTASQRGLDHAALRAFIEDVNDGTTLILPKPCAYAFTLPAN